MKDLAIALDHRPGALADLGETLGHEASASRGAESGPSMAGP